MKDYKRFVDAMVERHNARWAGVILRDGSVPAYAAKDEECREKCLRSARSFYWTVMSMGEMLDLPDLEGRYLEIIWKQGESYIYVYIFVMDEEVVMISTDKKLEEYFVELITCITGETGTVSMPGVVAFVTGDCEGNVLDTVLDTESLAALAPELASEEIERIFRERSSELFEKYAHLNRAGLGKGKYIEMIWENLSAWMFPYGDKTALAVFTTGKVETLFNIIAYLLELSGMGE
ncbi:MAG: hypothetical protein GXO25_05195 [Euryarchaeota archaeon]|nr:hypothetical protein [Euryarchaeota archaeon]